MQIHEVKYTDRTSDTVCKEQESAQIKQVNDLV